MTEIELPSSYPQGYMQMCVLGHTKAEIIQFERDTLAQMNCIEDKLQVLLTKDNHELLDELVFTGDIVLDERATVFYEKFKYERSFTDNKTSHRLELLILNYDLNRELEEKDMHNSRKI